MWASDYQSSIYDVESEAGMLHDSEKENQCFGTISRETVPYDENERDSSIEIEIDAEAEVSKLLQYFFMNYDIS